MSYFRQVQSKENGEMNKEGKQEEVDIPNIPMPSSGDEEKPPPLQPPPEFGSFDVSDAKEANGEETKSNGSEVLKGNKRTASRDRVGAG